jgi:hypothetical protein
MFEEAEEGGLVVEQIVQGGSAWQSNQIAPGDFLYEVDGVGVYRTDVDSVSKVDLSVCMYVGMRVCMCVCVCMYTHSDRMLPVWMCD